ncbi:MAG: hypothetical protein Q9164_004695 [Protoblastenia rupestris]
MATTVVIPFALLNLTLTPPLVKAPTSYFPCRPYQVSSSGNADSRTLQYYLGRAFLQGAFVGQNWDTGSYFLAQAPGPRLPESQVVIIDSDDTSILAIEDAPVWEDTWKGVLSKDGTNRASFLPNGSPSSTTPAGLANESSPGLSTRAKAGIGAACAVVVLAAMIFGIIWVWRRRVGRRTGSSALGGGDESGQNGYRTQETKGGVAMLVGEMEGTGHHHEKWDEDRRFEMEGTGQQQQQHKVREKAHFFEMDGERRPRAVEK